MCKVIEDMRIQEREEGRLEGIKEGVQTMVFRMLETKKYTIEDISAISGLSFDEVKELQTKCKE